MNTRTFTLPALLAMTAFSATPLSAQQPEATANWRVMLEKAVFARAYEGNPDATRQLFEQALAAAKASGEQGAEAAVLRQQTSGAGKQDPRSELVIGRLLQSIAATELAERLRKIQNINWDFYQRDPSTARSITKCLSGRVLVGEVYIDLRVEDLLQIADYMDTRYSVPILRKALEHKDPFVRTMAVEQCPRAEHLSLLIKALGDENQLVREAACQRIRNPEDLAPGTRRAMHAALLGALDLGTIGAIERTIDLPGFLARMQAASQDSVLAEAIIDQRAEPEINEWNSNLIAMTTRLVAWAEACEDPRRKAMLTTCAYGWLSNEQGSEDYPTELARRCMNLALANTESFTGEDQLDTLGVVVAELGSFDELARLGPKWLADERLVDYCDGLFSLARRLGEEHTEQLIELGVKLQAAVTADKHSRNAFGTYWNRLGHHDWRAAGTDRLESALQAITTLSEGLRKIAYSRFVLGVRRSPGSKTLIQAMQAHYATVATRGPVSDSERRLIANDLVSIGSKHAVDAALALGGRWSPGRQGEQYGDFLRRACAQAGEAGKRAILRSMRRGYTTPPSIQAGQQMTQTNWPIQVGGGRGGVNGWLPTPPPTNKVVFKKENKTAMLPSLLCVLPPDQAAQAARELWAEEKPPVSRDELVRVLLFAHSSKIALDALVQNFGDIASVPQKAEVLRIFGELLHPEGRKLIAISLDSDEPLIRHAALEAAQNVLAHARAKKGMRVYRDQ